MYLGCLIVGVFQNGYAKKDGKPPKDDPAHYLKALAESAKPLFMAVLSALLLSKADHRHFCDAAFYWTAESGMWFHSIYDDNSVCL